MAEKSSGAYCASSMMDRSGKAPIVAQGAVHQAPHVVCRQGAKSQEQGAGQEKVDEILKLLDKMEK